VPTLPPSAPAPFRRLGAGGQNPIRGPVIFGLIALLILVALPLYLWRKPRPMVAMDQDAGTRMDVADAGAPFDAGALAAADAGGSRRPGLALAEPKVVRCSPQRGGRLSGERCDAIGPFQEALARAVRDNAACAPPSSSAFTVSFVLSVDFDRKRLHLWAGRSGSLKKRNTVDLIRCVEHALTAPDFAATAHQYARYDINILAAYPGSAAGVALPGGS
jgi:hypothetical protein